MRGVPCQTEYDLMRHATGSGKSTALTWLIIVHHCVICHVCIPVSIASA